MSDSSTKVQDNGYMENVLWIVLIASVILFILAWVYYDPSERQFTLYNMSQSSTFDFPNFSGVIVIQDATNGGVTEWLVGGEEVKLVSCSKGCTDPSDPDSGLLAFNSAINGYTWTQTQYSEKSTFTFLTNRLSRNA
jgi:hypothetical protein